MNVDTTLELMRSMLWAALMIGAPVIGISMVIGLIISLVQVVTQVQEMTLTFVPKLLGVFFVLLLGGGWMLSRLLEYSHDVIASIPHLIH